jgi:hypothetical protein
VGKWHMGGITDEPRHGFGQTDRSWDTNLCPQGRGAGMLEGKRSFPAWMMEW